MRILVLGGTGAMGKHLVNILIEQKHDVTVTSRRQIVSSLSNIHYVRGDAHDVTFIADLLHKTRYDAVVDFMHYTTLEFSSRCDMYLSNTNHYIFLSSSRVYAKAEGCITEESPRLLDVSQDLEYLATDDYALSKARQEDILKASGRTNYTIIRPYITFSEERLQLGIFEKEDWLNRVFDTNNIVFSKDIASHYTSLTYGKDVAYAISRLVGNQLAHGQAFHIANPKSVSWEEIVHCYAKVIENKIGKTIPIVYEDNCFYLEGLTTKWCVKYSRLFDYYFDNSKVLSLVPDLVFTETLKGLQECLSIFLENPSFKYINPYPQARMDRLSNSLQSILLWKKQSDRCKYIFYRFAPLCVIRKRIHK